MVTQEKLKEMFNYVDGHLFWKQDYIASLTYSKSRRIDYSKPFGSLESNGRLRGQINKKNYLIHRLIFLYHNGHLPEYLDHIDSNPLNNRIENLRVATKQQNSANSKKNSNAITSKYKGVYRNRTAVAKPWRTKTSTKGKDIFIGDFATELEAALAYDAKVSELHGEFAKLNFIEV